jgi:hypothetical protein
VLSEEQLHESFRVFTDWRQQLVTSFARGCFSAAGLVLTPLLAATFDPRFSISILQFASFIVGSAACFVSGLIWYRRASKIQQHFYATTVSNGG